eukprot:1159680-Pelagomonas_calceolata.AAC.13
MVRPAQLGSCWLLAHRRWRTGCAVRAGSRVEQTQSWWTLGSGAPGHADAWAGGVTAQPIPPPPAVAAAVAA